MANSNVVVFRGKAMYAKILGKPVSNPFDDNLNWTIDLVLTPETVKEAKALGIGNKIKEKEGYLDGQPYMTFKQASERRDGTKNDPIKVVDIKGAPWDQNVEIGNLSDIDLKFAVVDNGKTKPKGVYPRSIRVLKLVPFSRTEFDPVDEDDEFFNEVQQAATIAADQADREDKQFKKDFDLDDDIEHVI